MFVDNVARWLVTLVLVGGFLWAVAGWRSRRRTAALVAAACALQLAVRLIWIPAVGLLFGPLTWSSNLVQRFFFATGTTLGQLSLAVSLGLLVYAAMGPAGRSR